jgi:hypothetical protein
MVEYADMNLAVMVLLLLLLGVEVSFILLLLACDVQCRTCSAAGPGNCTRCYQSSTLWDQISITAGNCPFEFVNFNLITDPITFLVPPAIHWRVTMDFWTFMHDPSTFTTKTINIIFKDFLTVSIVPNNTVDLDVYCVPIEWLYPIQGSTTKVAFTAKLTGYRYCQTAPCPANPYNPTYHQQTQSSVVSKWFFTRCAFNLELGKTYMNQNVEQVLKVPQQYTVENTFPWHQKKFYKATDTVSFRIEGHNGSGSEVYFRNFNIFKEYIPPGTLWGLQYL